MLLGASSGAGEPAGACDVSSALCNVRPGQRRLFFFASFQGGASGAWVIGARNHRPGVRTRVSEAAECLSGENHFREPLTTHHSPLSSPLSCIWTGRGGGCTLRPRNPSAVETLWSRPSIDHTASQIELCTASALGSAELRWTYAETTPTQTQTHTQPAFMSWCTARGPTLYFAHRFLLLARRFLSLRDTHFLPAPSLHEHVSLNKPSMERGAAGNMAAA